MGKKLSLMFAALLAFAAVGLAADLNGRWSWSEAGRRGNSVTVTLTLKVSGNKLTGTITGGGFGGRGGGPGGPGGERRGGGREGESGQPEETKISGGKVNGNSFSFKVTTEGPPGTSGTTEYKGTLTEDDTLDLEIRRPASGPEGQSQILHVTAERSLT